MTPRDVVTLRAVITGSASGLGSAATAYFLDRGARVAGLEISPSGSTVSEDCFKQFQMDISDSGAVESSIAEAIRYLGGIDAVVHCAGVARVGAVADTSDADWDTCMNVNARGTFFLMRAVVPHLVAGGGGSIVNVASVTATHAMRSIAAYSASKGAVTALTRSIARDYAADGVRANAVLPGTMVTPMVRKTYGDRDADPDAALAAAGRAYPLGRLGSVDDVVPFLWHLSSPEAAWTTGGVFTVDGGLTAMAGV
jgi:NAD(P)-dependent dehydrogenase (short-subunit alcohol dehydrogenase family)